MISRNSLQSIRRLSSRPLNQSIVLRRTNVTLPSHSRDTITSRDPNRPLPPLPKTAFRLWATTLPIFILLIGASAAAIFNYQKSSSSVVNSTLYALRTNSEARELLGDEIYFRDRIPWIWGESNAVRGRINIGFAVKGSKEQGYMRFRSFRHGGRMGKFVTEDWSLEMPDGRMIQLLDQTTSEQFGRLPGTS